MAAIVPSFRAVENSPIVALCVTLSLRARRLAEVMTIMGAI